MKPRLLIIDDERNTRNILERFLKKKYNVTLAEDGVNALKLLNNNKYDLVMTDLRMPQVDGMDILKETLKHDSLPCIIVTAYGSIEGAVDAVRKGAYDFIAKPVNFDHLEVKLEQALSVKKLKSENSHLKKELNAQIGSKRLISQSQVMNQLLATVKQIAPTRSTVLITGESGTGKELIAEALHNLSGRTGIFLPVHCASLSENLLESELFGHEKGAFTGAIEQKKGRFELAKNGSLFLDEIGEISQSIQVKLLRALEVRKFERVGGMKTITTDARVITATNKNLEEMVAEKEFREDLYFRLNVINIHIPPLRDRKEDIPILTKHFIDEFATENHKNIQSISENALEVLSEYAWAGNIRELRNCIERMVVLTQEDELKVNDIPINIRSGKLISKINQSSTSQSLEIKKTEKDLIIRALKESNENKTKAAEKLGINRRTLHRKLNKYGIKT